MWDHNTSTDVWTLTNDGNTDTAGNYTVSYPYYPYWYPWYVPKPTKIVLEGEVEELIPLLKVFKGRIRIEIEKVD